MNIIILLILAILNYAGTSNRSEESEEIANRDSIAKPGMFPYQAAIMRESGIFCGGSIISECHILTAAHCFVSEDPIKDNSITEDLDSGDVFIAVGLSLSDLKKNGAKHFIKQVTVHPNYKNFDFDIAVVKLMEPVQFNEYVQPIALSQEEIAPGGAVVSGYGELEEDTGKYPDNLEYAIVKILPYKKCLKYIKSRRYFKIKAVTFICTSEAGHGMCSGDSGGPLVINNNNDFLQVGVVAFSEECASYKHYSIYMNVSFFKPWIMMQMMTC